MKHPTATWKTQAGACDTQKQPCLSGPRASDKFSDAKFNLCLYCVSFQRNGILTLLLGPGLILPSLRTALLCCEPVKHGFIETSPKLHLSPKFCSNPVPSFVRSLMLPLECGVFCSCERINFVWYRCVRQALSLLDTTISLTFAFSVRQYCPQKRWKLVLWKQKKKKQPKQNKKTNKNLQWFVPFWKATPINRYIAYLMYWNFMGKMINRKKIS